MCLTDGREYSVGAQPLSLGRDAGSDVVVAGSEVSRQHAEIRNEPDGYILIDLSVNGTYVNGERIGKTHLLARADVIRIGNDEFRFYADAVDALARARSRCAGDRAARLIPRRGPPEGAAQQLSDTMHGLPDEEPARRTRLPRPRPRRWHRLLFRSGDFKGRRLPIKVPVVNIGRGDYNDIVIGDPSVSTMHAKLQRREAVWILTDWDPPTAPSSRASVSPARLPLSPGTTLRFGDVIALFEPLDDKVPAGRSGNTRLMGRLEPDAAGTETRGRPRSRRPRPPRRPIRMATPRPKGPSAGLVMSLLVLMAILAYLLLS